MKKEIENSFKIIAFSLFVLFCAFALAGCRNSNSEKLNKAVDMRWFPDTIGNFPRDGAPNASLDNVEAWYNNDSSKAVKYSFYDDRNMIDGYSAKNGETLLDAPGISLHFIPTDALQLIVTEGSKSAIAEAQDVDAMNDWANAFPYQKFGAKPPQTPIKIQMPPPDFVREQGKTDPDSDKKTRESFLYIARLWAGNLKEKPKIKISRVDPSTLIIDTYSGELSKDEINSLMRDESEMLRVGGFRQVFSGSMAYPFPRWDKDKAAANSNKEHK